MNDGSENKSKIWKKSRSEQPSKKAIIEINLILDLYMHMTILYAAFVTIKRNTISFHFESSGYSSSRNLMKSDATSMPVSKWRLLTKSQFGPQIRYIRGVTQSHSIRCHIHSPSFISFLDRLYSFGVPVWRSWSRKSDH